MIVVGHKRIYYDDPMSRHLNPEEIAGNTLAARLLAQMLSDGTA
jgi:hypothetical protein